MQGIIIAGGKGTRLRPITNIINKHLLLVYNKPMIQYSIETLKNIGIKNILIIIDKEYSSDFSKFLGCGKDFGVDITFKIQETAGGISDALSLAEEFITSEKFPVLLADNIFLDNFKIDFENFLNSKEKGMVFVSKVKDPKRFGILEISEKDKNKVKKIIEKPKIPKTDLAVTGLYFYHKEIFDFIRNIHPSKRGELEITDLNNILAKHNELSFKKIKDFWIDAGTFDSLLEAGNQIKKKLKK